MPVRVRARARRASERERRRSVENNQRFKMLCLLMKVHFRECEDRRAASLAAIFSGVPNFYIYEDDNLGRHLLLQFHMIHSARSEPDIDDRGSLLVKFL